jgi:hypothetical protein
MQWTSADGCHVNGVLVQAPLVYSGHYTISCRVGSFALSFRPDGEHHALGSFETLAKAKRMATRHRRGEVEAKQIWPPSGVGAESWPFSEGHKARVAAAKRSRQRELELDIDDFACAANGGVK